MESFLIYIGKSAIAAGAFYIVFLLLFQNQKQFVFNRFYLPVSLALSFVIPLITFTTVKYIEPTPSPDFSSFAYLADLSELQPPAFEWEWYHYLFGIYLLGVAGFLFHLILGHLKAISIIKGSRIQTLFESLVNITKKDVHPFSFFNKIVLSEQTLSHPNLDIIVNHEAIHIKEKHTIDILFTELLFLVQWFNPFAWLIKDAVKNNLEYKTDHEITKSNDPKTYQLAMVTLADKKSVTPFLTALNGSQLKNRIIMMKKKTKNKYALLKQLVVLPLLAVLIMGLSSREVKTEIISPAASEDITLIVDGEVVPLTSEEFSKLDLPKKIDEKEIVEALGIDINKVKSSILSTNDYTGETKLLIRTSDYIRGSNPEFDELAFPKENEHSDQKYIQGKVFSREDEKPLAGVGVYDKLGEKLATSDPNGEFSFDTDKKTDNIILIKSGFQPKHFDIDLTQKQETAITAYLNIKIDIEDEKKMVEKYILNYSQVEKSIDPVWYKPEKMPKFPGGETALRKYISDNIQYPENALKNGISGDVYVTFIVSKEGKAISPQISGGVAPSLDEEALRLIGSLPEWTPGKENGESVNTWCTVPIHFRITERRPLKISETGHIEFVPKQKSKTKYTKQDETKTNNNNIDPRIRNVKGFNNNPNSSMKSWGKGEPIYIVDGIEIESPLLDKMDPDFIKSITVLKYASATALYGEKAKNGAIVITTKGDDYKEPVYFLDGKRVVKKEAADILNNKNLINETRNLNSEQTTNDLLSKNDAVEFYSKKDSTNANKVSTSKASGKLPLIIVDGKRTVTDLNQIDPSAIRSVNVLKDEAATKIYGELGKNGVVQITTKDSKTISKSELPIVPNGNMTELTLNETDPDLVKDTKQIEPEQAVKKYGERGENGVFEINTEETKNENSVIKTPLELRKFIAYQIKYPVDAQKNNITGTVKLWAVIEYDGKITHIYEKNPRGNIKNIDEVVVTGYRITNSKKSGTNSEVVANERHAENSNRTTSDLMSLLTDEVKRVLDLTPPIDISELKNKTIKITVKFNLQN